MAVERTTVVSTFTDMNDQSTTEIEGNLTVTGSVTSASNLAPEYQAVKILTNAQIIQLPLTPVEVIAAPGANKLLFPTIVIARLNWVADYSNINATSYLAVDISGSFIMPLRQAILSGVSALLAGGGPDGTLVAFPLNLINQGETTTATPAVNPHTHHTGADSGFYDSDLVNKPLKIRMENVGDGPLGDGDAGNTLIIAVTYKVLNVVTGVFS